MEGPKEANNPWMNMCIIVFVQPKNNTTAKSPFNQTKHNLKSMIIIEKPFDGGRI